MSKITQNATFCNFDPLQSKNLTCWQKMKVIFEISTLELAKNTYNHTDLFGVLVGEIPAFKDWFGRISSLLFSFVLAYCLQLSSYCSRLTMKCHHPLFLSDCFPWSNDLIELINYA